LKRVNELKDDIKKFELAENSRGMSNDPTVKLTNAAKHLFKDLEEQGESFAPYNFV